MKKTYSSLLLDQDKKFTWNPIQKRHKFSYDAINNQYFFFEKNIIYFIETSHEQDFPPFSKKKKHKSKDLVRLLLGFYEELENIPHILETIIESDINPENNVIKYLHNLFCCYTQNIKNRLLLYKSISEFSMNFFSPFEMVSFEPIKNSEYPTFSILLSSISTSFLILEDHKFPFQSYIPFLNYINNSVTTASITPPSPEFLPKEKNSNIINDQLFTADYVNQHGICSNGNFLFILCSNNIIQIFPLLNGGTLSSPIVVHLDNIDVEIPQDASINAFENTFQIIYSENDEYKVLTFEIDLFIKNKISIKKCPTKYEFNHKLSCSDGITQVIIEPDYSFRVFDLIRKKQLLTSIFDQSLSKLPEDLTTTVVETNGSCISFIIQIQNDEPDNNNNDNENNNNNNNFAIYKTYSFNGGFLSEEKFVMNDPIVASCIDSINRCHWSVIPGGSSRFYVRRFNLIGGENPEIFISNNFLYPTNVEITPLSFVGQLISSLHRHLRGMINSQISPSLFLALKIDNFLNLIQLTEKVMNLPDEKSGMIIEIKQAMIECLVILISLNLKRIGCISKPIDLITTKVFEVVKKLPLNFSSLLFFSNFDYLMFDQKDEIVIFLIELLKSIENKYLISIYFRMMEQSKSLSMLRFRFFYHLLPRDLTKSSSIEPIILKFLLLHQRVLVRDSILFLQDNHLEVVNVKHINNNETTVIDLLGDYMQNIFLIFENVFSLYNPEEIKDLAVFDLFYNFLNLLSSLSEFHSIAHFAASFTSVIVNRLTDIFKSHPKKVLNIIFILGKLASTLLKGDEVTNLETKFSWIISSNIDLIENKPELIENLDDSKIEYFEDERINIFLDFQNDSLKAIYKKIKPLVNKNLNYQIKQIDKLAIIAFAKHLNCIDELLLFDESMKPSSQLRSAFDQMLVVRNEFRRSIQNKKDTTIFAVKCLMLFRMKSSFINDDLGNSKKLSDFVITKFEPSHFKKIIIGQRNRIKTTLIGFSLLDQNYVLNSDHLIHSIFNYCLSTIKSFKNIDSIFKMSQLNKANLSQIFLFFERMINNAAKENSIHLILVCYRFFRDVNCLNEVKNSVLKNVLEIYKKNPNNDSIFALALSLVNGITEIPSQILKIDSYNNLSSWILLFEATKNVSLPNEIVSFIIEYCFSHEISGEITRLLLRIIYNCQEQIADSDIFFNTCFLIIGNEIKKVHNFTKSSEIINFLRRILTSDDLPLKSNLINYILNFNLNSINEELLLGIMSTLGLNIEEIHPFSVVNYHQNRTELNQFYVISYEKNEFICYPKPFRINSSKVISIPNKNNVYAIPQTEIIPEKFPYYEYILQYFYLLYQFCNSNPLIYTIYMQVFASYCRSQEFVSLISEDILSILYSDSIPFHDIQNTIEYINKINCAKITPQFFGFNVLSSNSKYTTFLSPAIEKQAGIFEINIHFPKKPNDKLYLGIVSDNLEPYYTRYSLVSFPDGTLYPKSFDSTEDQFKKIDKNIKITVYTNSKKFKINDKEFKFPIGSQFRVLFVTSMKDHHLITIEINSNSFVFNNTAPIPIQTFNVSKESVLYPSYTKYSKLPYDYNNLPDFPQIVYNYSDIEKYVFIQPKSDDIVVHGYNSKSLSEELFNSLLFASLRKLAFQYSSVSLMRIINTNIKFAKPIVFKFFQYLIYLIESFSGSLMEQDSFPFDMSMPIWDKEADPIYFSLENEAKKCLQKIVSDPENIEIIAKGIENLFNSKKLHSLMFPQESLSLFIGNEKNINLYRDKSYILFHNDFDYSTNASIKILQEAFKLPVAYTTRSKAVLVDILEDKRITGYLCIDPMNNDWLINTPIEMLLLLKNFIYISNSEEHQKMIKSVIFDCFIINSPVASLYLNQFADFVMSQIPPSMTDQGQKYTNQLCLVGSRLKNNSNQTFITFYQREQLMFNKMAVELSSHFPEFLQTPFPPPETKMCRIPLVVIDPGDLTENFSDRISSLRTFLRPYRSIVGFPFWEILPYWIKLTDLRITFNNSDSDLNSNSSQRPQATRINNEIIKVSNPTNSIIKAYLKKRAWNRREIPEDSFLMCSKSDDFKDADYIDYFHFSDHISINNGDTFFALYLPDQPNSWDIFYLDLEYNEPRQNSTRRSINNDAVYVDEDQIRDLFINDMQQFAVEWRENETYELLNQIPDDKFSDKKFDEIERIARLSSLSSKYNSTVVVLRALILHHYNYIFSFHKNQVSEEIWSTTNSLLSIETQSQVVLSMIPSSTRVPSIEIDRQKSQFLVSEKKGDHSFSIISQLSSHINRIGASNFRNKEKPWNVVYKNERGIDAGGLSRDLIVEASSSVFQPTSKLMVQIDNSTRDETCYYYVPNEAALDELDEFYSIGVLIGIIMRTGFIQDFPLAPFIWKWIAGEVIIDDDIFDCDRNFRLLFDGSNSNNLKWSAVCWNGSVSCLKNRNPNSLVSKEQIAQYQHECIAFRKQSIKLMVEQMRKGFYDNIGFSIHYKLRGLLLSRLVQGSGIITIEQLKKITVVSAFDGGMNNHYVQRFWRAVSRFNKNELRLLLKFITSLTRIPSDSRLNEKFTITIDMLSRPNPDSALPNASTCFNQLHLPCYSNDDTAYRKILYAVKNCSSMENY